MAPGDAKVIKIPGQEGEEVHGKPGEAMSLPGAFCEPSYLRDAITSVAQKVRRARNRPLFILAACFIDDDFVERVWARRKEVAQSVVAAESAPSGVDVLISSPGGELNSCFTVARLLGRWLTSWQALVPHYATSGATLVCLGASSVVMSQRGQLGPLDPLERFFESARRSPLEAIQALRELRDFSLESIETMAEFLLEQKVPPELAFASASEAAIRFIEPIITKVDPYDIGIFSLNSTMALAYCRRIALPRDDSRKTQREVDPSGLVKFSPGHELVIDLEAAKALNFTVCEASPELEDLFDEMRPLLEKVHQYVGFVA